MVGTTSDRPHFYQNVIGEDERTPFETLGRSVMVSVSEGSNDEQQTRGNYYSKCTACPRRNVPDFGRVFLMLKYANITQNTYVQS
jgi:hypothetical protein